jgi:hypothetical protein
MNRYKGIMLSLKKYLKENPGYKVYCTGHSLVSINTCTLYCVAVAVITIIDYPTVIDIANLHPYLLLIKL